MQKSIDNVENHAKGQADKQEDLRIRRTRALLQQALFDLTIEKGFAAITVRDIAERAMVNRSTFYRHYLDKYDLLDKYLDELEAQIAAGASQMERASLPGAATVPTGLLRLIEHVQRYADFYRVMLGENGDQAFTYRFRQLAENRYRLLFARIKDTADSSTAPREMRLPYISYAGVGAILWWLENGQPSSAEQLAIWLSQLNMTSAGLTMQQADTSP